MICSINFLRSTNVFISSLLFPVLYSLTNSLQPFGERGGNQRLAALYIFLYPINFFYYCLYYTDVLSTMTFISLYYVTTEYYSIVPKSPTTSTLVASLVLIILSALSILSRQTNAVWILYLIGVVILKRFEDESSNNTKESNNIRLIFKFIKYMFQNIPLLFSLILPFLIPVLAFVYFVFVNKGVVVGKICIS